MIPDRFKRAWRLLWGSVAFRLTLNYGVLAVVTTLVLLAFIYVQTIGALHGQVYRQTASRSLYLSSQFEYGGRQAVIAIINGALMDRLGVEHELFLYLDEQGRKLAGNLEPIEDLPRTNTSITEMSLLRDGELIEGRLQVRVFPDDSVLIVGRDLEDTYSIKALIKRASLAAVLVALVLVGSGTYVFRQELALRVGAIRRTAAQISAGQFKERIPTTGGGDEFAYLNRDINDMLDRVEGLMTGVRHVTDTIAHNLRTPLTRVLGRLRTAQRAGTSVAELQSANDFAIKEIENLTILFDKLLQIAEIEAGAQRQRFVHVGLRRIAADVVELYEPLAEDQGIRLRLLPGIDYQVLGDADLLASAVANVVDNAIKYARHQVDLSVDVFDRNTVCVRVTDDGPGIPSAEYAHMGRHFHRLSSERSGYGLGLTSVYAITRLHHGEVSLEDNRPGLQLTIALPAVT